jgi:hypothetical protein
MSRQSFVVGRSQFVSAENRPFFEFIESFIVRKGANDQRLATASYTTTPVPLGTGVW